MRTPTVHTTKHEGKIALVTGGTSGIGLATAHRLAREGATVVVTGRRQTELDAAVRAIGPDASGVRGDIANLEHLDVLKRCASLNALGVVTAHLAGACTVTSNRPMFTLKRFW